MKGKKAKIFGVMMALVLAVSLASVGIAAADPGVLKWTEIDIPEDGADGDYALWLDSDVGPMAVTPGGTIFAASGADVSQLMRSADGGYTWKAVMTELDGEEVEDSNFGAPIVDIVVSPDWDDDDTLVVATTDDVYISDDRGVEFMSMIFIGGTITSLDLAADEDGNLDAMLVGADDVYLLKWPVGGWTGQEVGGDVLDVAFSPDYATDEQIIAVVVGSTMVKAKFADSAWGATISDATIKDQNDVPIDAEYASIGFPDDYDAYDPTLFVGVAADGDGDVYLIDWDGSDWEATDLNVRGIVGTNEPTETDIWSIVVSGDDILVGTDEFDRTPEEGDTQYLVYVSTDGGTNWVASDKQPTGEIEATVVLGSAYVGTKGLESAFSAADDEMMSWNQRSLIDTEIEEINDVAASLAYATDGTLHIATSGAGETSLWQTTDAGATWERVYCSTITNMEREDPADRVCNFNMVKLANDGDILVAEKDSDEMRVSDDAGATWLRKVAKEPITALAVASLDTLYTGDAMSNVWETTNGGVTWDKPDESEITGTVVSIALGTDAAFLVGNDAGTVYICRDKSVAFEFERVGPGAAGAGNMYVAFDTGYGGDGNDIIYAASAGSAIYRFVIDESTVWKTIYTGTAITGLVATDDGTLYAPDTGGVARSVNPTSIIPGEPTFETLGTLLALPAGATLDVLRVVPGSNILFAVNTATDPDQLLTITDTLTGKVSQAGPTDGATSGDILENQGLARVVLSWEGRIGAKSYQYQVALDEAMLTLIDDASGSIAGQVKDVELWLGTTYYWRVKVTAPLLSQWSETWSFNTPLGPGAARPILESPEAGQEVMALRPVLEWTGLVDAINYELVVAEDCDWNNLVVDKTGEAALGTDTIYAITIDLDYGTDYCWKVRALSETTESPWSDTGTFTIMEEEGPAEAEPTPTWVWVVIAISAVLLIAVIVLIARTRRAV